jgi:nucleoside-diphosphate-sugar epimerase
MSNTILITGSEGLIGKALAAALSARGFVLRRYDRRLTRQSRPLNVLDEALLCQAVSGCIGVVHLAAVSRVVLGERDPEACWRTNVEGTVNVLRAVRAQKNRPFVILASSREVYGQPTNLPVTEDAPVRPINVYGRSKVEGERLCLAARSEGLQTAVLRLSNVYGSTEDHADRVVPCFAAQAVRGQPLRVDGREHTFDFTHLEDTVSGFLILIAALLSGERTLPPIHLLTGQGSTLGQLANWASLLAGGRSEIVEAPPRSFDVAHFYGNPRRAEELLGWQARIPIREGLSRLIDEFAQAERKNPARAGLGDGRIG